MEAKIYINGNLVASSTLPGTLSTNTAPLRISRSGLDASLLPFFGLIDEIDIYNRTLSAAEIQAIFKAGSAGKCTTVAPPPTTTTIPLPTTTTIPFPPPTTTTTIPVGAPTVDLDSPKTELRAGDSFILDLLLRSGGSRSGIDLFFGIEIKGIIPVTVFLGPTLKFGPDRIPVVTNLTPIDASVRIFGPVPSIFVPSIFGELIIPPNVLGSFDFEAEVVDSRTKAGINSDRVAVNIR